MVFGFHRVFANRITSLCKFMQFVTFIWQPNRTQCLFYFSADLSNIESYFSELCLVVHSQTPQENRKKLHSTFKTRIARLSNFAAIFSSELATFSNVPCECKLFMAFAYYQL